MARMRNSCGLTEPPAFSAGMIRRGFAFCQLSPDESRDFDAVKVVSVFPAGAILFMEEQRSQGIYLLTEGQVKLVLNSGEGRALVLRIAKPGEALGLFSALSKGSYEATAQTIRSCQVAFVSSSDLKVFLQKHTPVFEHVASHLGWQYRALCSQLCAVGFGASAFERTARFLLNWSASEGAEENGDPFELRLSHEKIAEHIGASRESVTRALIEFRRRGLIVGRRSIFAIIDRAALEDFRLQPASPTVRQQLAASTPIRESQPPAIPHSKLKRVTRLRKK